MERLKNIFKYLTKDKKTIVKSILLLLLVLIVIKYPPLLGGVAMFLFVYIPFILIRWFIRGSKEMNNKLEKELMDFEEKYQVDTWFYTYDKAIVFNRKKSIFEFLQIEHDVKTIHEDGYDFLLKNKAIFIPIIDFQFSNSTTVVTKSSHKDFFTRNEVHNNEYHNKLEITVKLETNAKIYFSPSSHPSTYKKTGKFIIVDKRYPKGFMDFYNSFVYKIKKED